jgi:hypothetical protein
MVNSSAGTIHVGPRYEELSPTEKIEALVAADGYAALTATEEEPPPPEEKNKIWAGLAVIAFGAIFAWSGWEFMKYGMPIFFFFAGLGIMALGVWKMLEMRATISEYYEEPPEVLPVWIRSKDFVSRANDVKRDAGVYMVSFVTRDGNDRTAEMASERRDMLAPNEVGLLSLRLERVVDFRRLEVRHGKVRHGAPPLQRIFGASL